MNTATEPAARPACVPWRWPMLALAACAAPSPAEEPVFYRPGGTGSESQFEPLRMSLHYVLDNAQLEDAETSDFDGKLKLVWDHLREPKGTIERSDGGRSDFVNSELFPIDADNLDDSLAILPNVFLHGLGGGMLYRKTGEWFAAHDVPLPWFAAGIVAMATEVLGEAAEKPASDDSDEIADVLIYRPIGMWFCHDVTRSRWARDELGLVDWPYLLIYDADDGKLVNFGMNYVLRPSLFATEDTSLFAYTGITNLFGLSHRLVGEHRLSWGGGVATVTVDPVELRWSAGVFWDEDRGLLASLIANGADGYAVRANVYPGALFADDVPLALFLGVRDDGTVTAGVQWELPIGIGF